MNAVSFVAYCGELAGLPRADAMQRAHEVLFYVGLGEARYRNVETYSTGMKQRIKLAQALVHDPDLLFLDEPTNGMDPKGRDEMLALVRDIAANKGIALILSSHLLPDVEFACEHVVVLDKGAVATQGPISALKGTTGRVFELRVKGEGQRFADVLRAEGIECHGDMTEVMRVFMPEHHGSQLLFQLAARHGMQVRHLRPSVPTLEDVFARAVGEELYGAHSRSGLPSLRRAARAARPRMVGHCARRHHGAAARAAVSGAPAFCVVAVRRAGRADLRRVQHCAGVVPRAG